jgi:hypothetical protein
VFCVCIMCYVCCVCVYMCAGAHGHSADEECLNFIQRFRPNVVMSGCHVFEEDIWAGVVVGSVVLPVQEPCERCSMVNVDPNTGSTRSNLFATLAAARRKQQGGAITFGVLVECSNVPLLSVMLSREAVTVTYATPFTAPFADVDGDVDGDAVGAPARASAFGATRLVRAGIPAAVLLAVLGWWFLHGNHTPTQVSLH